MGIRDGFWKLFGASASKEAKHAAGAVEASREYDEWAAALTDSEFPDAAHSIDLMAQSPQDVGRFLALIREGADRTLGLRPFDVQLQGALRMIAGDVVEMSTGEGKTLSGAIAAVGYSLQGHRVHVISVNDYLAGRDMKWMSPLYELFGLTVAAVGESSSKEQRRGAYNADVTYGSVNEIGFDVLREQLCTNPGELISPRTEVAIIDEADSVLVDEALVPLVLAGSTKGDAPGDDVIAAVRHLSADVDYKTDAEKRNIFLTEAGARRVEQSLGIDDLYDEQHVASTLVQVNVALHAHVLLQRDVHYIVRDGKVQLINSSRGRVAELQRWPDGLQAAVETKEGLELSDTGEILDSITIQALVGKYKTVCGMTGTALAAGNQFREFYDLGVSVIEPNTPCIRVDETDRVFITRQTKNLAIVEYIQRVHATKQPILVGTHDVAESEELAQALHDAQISCTVLNAKNDEEEAAVIAEAGALGRVTVSTQMAGRGTDIRLGGSHEKQRDEVVAAGGLCVVGTGRHRTLRLDNQLRGRAGRQGDPGRSIFFTSVQDDLIVAALDDDKLPTKFDEKTGEISGDKVIHLVDHAQRITEGAMLNIHSNTWRYSQLLADQRSILSARREALLSTDKAYEEIAAHHGEKIARIDEEFGREVSVQGCREIMLWFLDRGWADHLAEMADVRESIHLRALGRENPLDEFHRIAIGNFKDLASSAVTKSFDLFDQVTFTAQGVDLDGQDMARPNTTWTYMVHDNPMAAGGNVFSGMMSAFR